MKTATLVRSPVPDLERLFADALRPWSKAYDSWRAELTRETRTCECDDRCGADDCSCRCCVADSDLLVEARVGENRIVPIRIENHWRRARTVELELSSWTHVDGATVAGQLTTPTSFTLQPCGEEQAILAIHIASQTPNATGGNERIGDVADCQVAYADLRVTGCDIRPIRIAVAILPRGCDGYVVDCRCGCC